jgi:hypothetical protein
LKLIQTEQAREAFELLRDVEEKAVYDAAYQQVQEKWAKYYQDVEDWERRTAAEAEEQQRREAAEAEERRRREGAEAEAARTRSRAEEIQRIRKLWAMGEKENKRCAAIQRQDEMHRLNHSRIYRRRYQCPGCDDRINRLAEEYSTGYEPPSQEEYQGYLQLKAEYSERRAQEKRREQQEREAKERMQKEKERAERLKRADMARVKETRSSQVAQRVREQQEQDALLRMAKSHVAEQHAKHLQALQDGGLEPIKGGVVDIG